MVVDAEKIKGDCRARPGHLPETKSESDAAVSWPVYGDE
jgi:hypothetical protein